MNYFLVTEEPTTIDNFVIDTITLRIGQNGRLTLHILDMDKSIHNGTGNEFNNEEKDKKKERSPIFLVLYYYQWLSDRSPIADIVLARR